MARENIVRADPKETAHTVWKYRMQSWLVFYAGITASAVALGGGAALVALTGPQLLLVGGLLVLFASAVQALARGIEKDPNGLVNRGTGLEPVGA